MLLVLVHPAHAQAPIIVETHIANGKESFSTLVATVSNSELVSAVIACESNFRTNVYGDHGLAYGPAQFHEEAFNRMKKAAMKKGEPFFYMKYKNPNDQVLLLSWALKNGYGKEWTCYRKVIKKEYT